MRWSKLKHLLEERFAASIRGRVSINQARYRYTREEVGRIWVSIDGVEIAAFDTSTALRRRYEVASDLMDINSEWGSSEAFGEADAKACDLLRQAGEYSDYAAAVDLKQFLSHPIKAALTSPSPLLRALAVADGRVGKLAGDVRPRRCVHRWSAHSFGCSGTRRDLRELGGNSVLLEEQCA